MLVPNVLGLSRTDAEAKLDSYRLRHIARFPFGEAGDGTASAQSPSPGTSVADYSIVIVSYPSPLGPLEDSPVEGPTFSGSIPGSITRIAVDRSAASITLATYPSLGESVEVSLYEDPPDPQMPRAEWMRRGAILGLAQRALTNKCRVLVDITDSVVDRIEVFDEPFTP
jgi:PASTA domain